MENIYEFEKNWWGSCTNTFGEDSKHYIYATHMGLGIDWQYFTGAQGKKILDIGGGPTSMLLKTSQIKSGKVVDQSLYPPRPKPRHTPESIEVEVKPGEEVNEIDFDEVWIYNCLQHVIDPQLIIENAKRAAPVLRIFEWINIPPHEGHPHELTKSKLDEWIGQQGQWGKLNVSTIPNNNINGGLFGDAYFGYFKHR